MTDGTLRRSAFDSFLWLVFQAVGGRVMSLLSQLILAYVLAPADFGLYALSLTVVALCQAFTGFGIEEVAIQRHEKLRYWVSSLNYLSLVLGILGGLAAVGAGFVATYIYKQPELPWMVAIQALALPIQAAAVPSGAILKSRMQFRFLAAFSTFETFVTQLATIALALAGASAFAFVLPMPLTAIMRLIVYRTRARPIITTRTRKKQLASLLTVGAGMFGTRLLQQSMSYADYFILGLFASTAQLGAYYFAFRIAVQWIFMFALNLTQVLLPSLSSMAKKPSEQRRLTSKAVQKISYAAMFICFLQASLADPILRLVFGEKWIASIPLVQILSVGVAFDAAGWVCGSLMTAQREYTRQFKLVSALTAAFIVAIIIGARFGGATGVAIAVALSWIASVPLWIVVALRDETDAKLLIKEVMIVAPLVTGSPNVLGYIIGTSAPCGLAASAIISGLISTAGTLFLLRVIRPELLVELSDALISRLPKNLRRAGGEISL